MKYDKKIEIYKSTEKRTVLIFTNVIRRGKEENFTICTTLFFQPFLKHMSFGNLTRKLKYHVNNYKPVELKEYYMNISEHHSLQESNFS